MFEATVSMLDAGIEDILYLYNSNSYSGVKSWAVFAQPWRHTPSRIMRNGFSSTRETLQQMDDVANYLERLF